MELTAQRLAQLLDRPVRSFVKEPLGLFSSKVSRLTVTLKPAASSTSFVCKEPHPERRAREGESFANEARFYAEIAPALQIRTPACYAHAEDFILLEDVDYLPFSWQRGASEAHAHCALGALGELHRAPLDHHTWVPAFADPDFRAALADRFCAGWARNRSALCQWCPAFEAVGEHLNSRLADYYAALASPGVLLHGDAHLENIPLLAMTDGAQDSQVVFFDWQGPRRGHPLFDVAYFNVMSFPVEIRRAQEPALLQTYLGHPPSAAERFAYRYAIAARASGIVEMTADWSRGQLDEPGTGWVANRCFSAAVDHRVQDLLD